MYFHPDAIAKILSFAEVENKFLIHYDKATGFKVIITEALSITFTRKGKHYVADSSSFLSVINSLLEPMSHMACPTVEENKKKFTKREVSSAQLARDVSRQLGFPSDRGMIDLISAGSMLNIPVTTKYVSNADAIFGPDPAVLKGK